MKKELIVSVALASFVLGTPALQAANVPSRVSSIKKEVNFQNKNFKTASKDIQKGLNNTLNAITALQKKKTTVAKKDLQVATKYFDKALKVDPKLGLVPIEESVVAYQYNGSVKNIKDALKMAKSMLNKNNLQFARDILVPLKDEIDITTHYIPMDVYPNATKIAAKLLAKGKTKQALLELKLGLSTIVGDQVTMPVPLLVSQDLVTMASKIDKSKKKEASSLLIRAKAELDKAVLLGYASKHSVEYNSLKNKISAIQKEIKGGNIVERLYKDIKKDFKSLVHKVRGERKSFDPNSVWNSTKKEHKNAVSEEDKDVVNFAQKSKADAF
ncbi:MAG: YfdX family protein [Sulfurospirillum sp.]